MSDPAVHQQPSNVVASLKNITTAQKLLEARVINLEASFQNQASEIRNIGIGLTALEGKVAGIVDELMNQARSMQSIAKNMEHINQTLENIVAPGPPPDLTNLISNCVSQAIIEREANQPSTSRHQGNPDVDLLETRMRELATHIMLPGSKIDPEQAPLTERVRALENRMNSVLDPELSGQLSRLQAIVDSQAFAFDGLKQHMAAGSTPDAKCNQIAENKKVVVASTSRGPVLKPSVTARLPEFFSGDI